MAGSTPKDIYWLGFDLGGTKMQVSVFDNDFQTIARRRRKTKGFNGPKAVLKRMVDSVQEVLTEAAIDASKIAAIGVGVPGPVDQSKGIVLEAVNLGWRKVKLGEALETEFGCPTVILNDVDAGVYGEYRFGAAKTARTVIGVFPGTGIGGGCVYDGDILRGRGKSCMEIGHIQVVGSGRLCGCGLRGCLETEASRLAISGDAAIAAFRGDAPNLLAEAGTDLSNIRSSVLAKSIAAGDAAVEQIVRRAANRIGIALSSIIHLLAPDHVVLGGGLVQAMPQLIVSNVADAANKHVMPSFRDSFKVVAAKLGDDATVLGAAAWAARHAARLVEAAD